ncbi:hypothetical protein BDM02DRAFT_1233145 [Thelephora ganbajun]|uniref:Uncharacterized protein n=1 Tax=Thelephora ganbajun TaxID=370292 RepID=A0ACB6Z2U9_THEGA|nr:hypothetical protein BDM02DRAFT_1233145 [Thelephora ganbajun]
MQTERVGSVRGSCEGQASGILDFSCLARVAEWRRRMVGCSTGKEPPFVDVRNPIGLVKLATQVAAIVQEKKINKYGGDCRDHNQGPTIARCSFLLIWMAVIRIQQTTKEQARDRIIRGSRGFPGTFKVKTTSQRYEALSRRPIIPSMGNPGGRINQPSSFLFVREWPDHLRPFQSILRD